MTKKGHQHLKEEWSAPVHHRTENPGYA